MLISTWYVCCSEYKSNTTSRNKVLVKITFCTVKNFRWTMQHCLHGCRLYAAACLFPTFDEYTHCFRCNVFYKVSVSIDVKSSYPVVFWNPLCFYYDVDRARELFIFSYVHHNCIFWLARPNLGVLTFETRTAVKKNRWFLNQLFFLLLFKLISSIRSPFFKEFDNNFKPLLEQWHSNKREKGFLHIHYSISILPISTLVRNQTNVKNVRNFRFKWYNFVYDVCHA